MERIGRIGESRKKEIEIKKSEGNWWVNRVVGKFRLT